MKSRTMHDLYSLSKSTSEWLVRAGQFIKSHYDTKDSSKH